MNIHKQSLVRIIALVVLIPLLFVSCGGGVYPETAYPENTPFQADVATEEPAAYETVELELYLPYISDAAVSQIDGQLETFMEINPDVVVYTAYANYYDLKEKLATMAAAGGLPGMAALDYNAIAEFAWYGLLEPLNESQVFWDMYLYDAFQSNVINGSVYAYPWQRYSCSPNYLSLVIFESSSEAEVSAAQRLGEYLTNASNQQANLDNQAMNWYPTLNEFYGGGGQVYCDSVSKIKLDPALAQNAISYTYDTAINFADVFGIWVDSTKSEALDAGVLGGAEGTLASTLAPAFDANQYYGERLVVGSLSVDDDTVSSQLGLPFGTYMIACYPETNDCAAITTKDEWYYIDYLVSLDYLPAPVSTPTVAFIAGSIGGCFWVLGNQYCVWFF